MCVAGGRHRIKLSGVITGVVSDSMGIPQMGAIVLLYNRQDRVYGKVQTDDLGQFRFLGLFPDLYSVKVTLATFVPALKKNILVQPGMRSVLNVNLNTLFSTIQLAYPSIENGSLMSDDWKWVLRTASSTRPVLRFAADPLADQPGRPARHSCGLLRYARHPAEFPRAMARWPRASANEADLGTAFALATSLYGNNLLQVSGNVGYGSQTGVPTAAFRTSYSRDIAGGSPEVSLTMRQLFLPGRLGAALTGTDSRFAHAALHVRRLRRPHPAYRRRRAPVWIHARFGLVPRSPELLQPLRAPELQGREQRRSGFCLHLRQRRGPTWPARSPRMRICSAISARSACSRASLCAARGRKSSAAKSTN